jgi:hypothetical protein
MPGFIGPMATVGRPGEVHTSALNPLGTEAVSTEGYVYKYLKGVASTVAGDFVRYDGAGATALCTTTGPTSGPIAIATAAVDSTSEYGWYLIDGRYAAANVATHSAGAGKALFASGTAGRATSTPATEATIVNAFSDGNSASNLGPVIVRRAAYTGDIST